MEKVVKVFSPATIANVVCGYDVLGIAIHEPGDEIIMKFNNENKIVITKIDGDEGKLSKDAEKNVASKVVQLFLEKINSTQGIDIHLIKKMPLNSGLGSSAASSTAALVAINELMGNPLTKKELLPLAMEGERLACGNAHADNVAPALFGGLVLIKSYNPLDVVQLPYPENLHFAIIHPHVDVPTGEARKIMKDRVSLKDAVTQWGNVAGLVAGFCMKDLDLIGRSMIDTIIEPIRAMLIPHFYEMKKVALENQAIGFGISGSGPSVFALCKSKSDAENIALKLQKLLSDGLVESEFYVTEINHFGAKTIT